MKRFYLAAFLAFLTTAFSSVANAGVIGVSEVALNGLRSDVRSVETNLGNLVADSLYWQTAESGLSPTIAIANGGSIRNNSVIAAGPIDSAQVQSILPFSNEIVVIEDVTVSDLLLALENSVSQIPSFSTSGRFLQISGFLMSWDTQAAAGPRIIDVFLEDGTALVDNGAIVSALTLNIATNSFLANGGDSYSMFPGSYNITGTGVVDNVALSNYIQNGLGGVISASDYAEGGEGRIIRDSQIVPVPEPGTLGLLGLGLLGVVLARRKRV